MRKSNAEFAPVKRFCRRTSTIAVDRQKEAALPCRRQHRSMNHNSILRIIFSAFVAFAVTPFATAQDAAAPIRRSPAPSATPEATATPAPEHQESPQPSPTPQPREQPAPKRKSSDAPKAAATDTPRRDLDEKPIRAIETPPPSRRATPPDSDVDQRPVLVPGSKPTFDFSEQGGGYAGATIRALENRWQKAIMKHDTDVIDQLVADDFIAVAASGRLGSKSTLLSQVKSDRDTYTSATVRSMTVRAYGPHVAVVTGIAKESGTSANGQSFTNSRRFTDMWMQRRGKWQCVASHATQLPKR